MAQSISSRKRSVRSVPLPACQWPLPPEPSRMWKSSSRTGKRNSRISGSVRRELVMWVWTASAAVEAGAVGEDTGRRARADRLVVLIAVVAEGEVVHRALRRSERSQRPEQAVGDGLRGLDIARHHRRRIARREHRAFGNDDVDRPQAAGVHGDVALDHDAEAVEHGGAGHRLGRVEVGRLLGRRAGEVDRRLAPVAVDGDPDADSGTLVGGDREFRICAALR